MEASCLELLNLKGRGQRRGERRRKEGEDERMNEGVEMEIKTGRKANEGVNKQKQGRGSGERD